MKLSELRNSYPSLPQDTHDKMMRTARNASANAVKPRWGLRKVVVVALVLMLALASVAYAAARLGIIDYLIWNDEPSAELSASAQAVNVRNVVDGISLSVTGAMYDGEQLALSYTVENLEPENPAIFRIKSITFGDVDIGIDFAHPDDNWTPWMFGMQELSWSRNPVAGGMRSYVIPEAISGKQEIVMQYTISRPIKPIVIVDDQWVERLNSVEDEETMAERQSMVDGLIASGVTIADAEHLDAEWWHEQGYIVVDSGGYFYWPNIEYDEETMSVEEFDALMEENHAVWSMEAQMEETAQGAVRFTVDADHALQYRREYVFMEGDQLATSLPDCTVELKRLSLTPLSTNLQFWMYPPENTKESAISVYDTYGWLDIRDADGQELQYADMEYLYGDRNYYCNDDGMWVVAWDWSMPGITAYPDEIHITAMVDWEERTPSTIEQEQAFAAFAEKMRFKMK